MFFEKIPLGQYLATLGEKLQREFFQRYLQDFIAMTMKVASEAELKVCLCNIIMFSIHTNSKTIGSIYRKVLSIYCQI